MSVLQWFVAVAWLWLAIVLIPDTITTIRGLMTERTCDDPAD